MFKIIKLELFDSFHCLMDKCPDNCCNEDWIISVDNQTYELYQEIGLQNLNSFVTADEPHTIIKENGKCPFITPEGLCLLHKELGEDYLGNTCRSYPRFVSTYEGKESDLFIENIGLSCPAAADWIVRLNRICVLNEQTYYEQQSEVGKKTKISEAEAYMKKIIAPLQTKHSYEEGIAASCEIAGGKYNIVALKHLKEHDLLLRNISICFLFENLMLESKKENADYSGVLSKACNIVKLLDKAVGERIIDDQSLSDDIISDCLYKIMRKKDH